MITYLKRKHEKVLLGHLDWGLGIVTEVTKIFFGLCIVNNVSKWSNLLLKMG